MNISLLRKMSALDAFEILEAEWLKDKNSNTRPNDLNHNEIVTLPQLFQQRQYGPHSIAQSLESQEHVKALTEFLNKHAEKDLPLYLPHCSDHGT